MTKEEEEKIHKIVENMSDEEIEDRIRQDEQGEEEAIEYIKKRIKVCNENADICDDNNFNEEATYLREESYMLETVLNMLKEKDAEIEQKNTEIAEKNAEIKTLTQTNKSYKGMIRKKDKIIYEMAKAFRQDDVRSVEEIIKYFERKATKLS